ncbi:L-aspartate oxidase [Glaciibacter sp. 2TAF33]|uniref:L-aspartate oxidase n=1 Tax=Glaciibacter sp. 2TAF33 TaxID=3233015 RepID=UPI003F933A41
MASVLVVGSGLAGLIAAIRASDAGHDVTLVTKAALSESNTRYAQGGIAAALFPDDTVDSHVRDTLHAGAGLVDAEIARVLCSDGPERVRDLIRFGVAFDRDESGLTRGLEAAHSKSRVLHAGGDATGAAISSALGATVQRRMMRNPRLVIREHTMVVDLLVDGDRVAGATVFSTGGVGGESAAPTEHLRADAVILATGGAGMLYRHTTNPAVATGDGIAAAWRAGASVADLEFYQFHPTALAVPGTPLVSEAVRGEGAVLRNAHGERFMLGVHPDAELAPRDVVARAIALEMAAQDGEPVMLDATGLGPALLESRFPTITAACRAAGLDWAVEAIPVAPAAHYWMGGIVTDGWGRSTLPGLFAVGETARTGAHGANRLASNSLLEAAVFADRAVRALGEPVPMPGPVPMPRGPVRTSGQSRHTPGAALASPGDAALPPMRHTPPDAPVMTRDALQRLMWREAGVLRSGEGLAAASATLAGAGRPTAMPGATAGERMRAQEDANLLDLARLTVCAALGREESRGAHRRADFPRQRAELASSLAWTRGSARSVPVDFVTSPSHSALGAQPHTEQSPTTTPPATAPSQAEEALAC